MSPPQKEKILSFRYQHFSFKLEWYLGEFWEKEFESLLFVIEMKSERVREQEIKLQHMAALVGGPNNSVTHNP